MKLMILGASGAQLNAIKRAKELGYKVVATDYYTNSPGKLIADECGLASTFDYEETLKVALETKIDGIMTTGTDQPVYTVNKVADKLSLPRFLSVNTAYAVTNKRVMKEKFLKAGIPTPDYRIIKKDFTDSQLEGLEFPVVVKPFDSQGQRGIFKLNTIKEVRLHFDDVIKHSREDSILVESYYKNDEITISGWVRDGKAKVLTITDRVTFDNDKYIGICSSHEFPSKHYKQYKEEFIALTDKIVDAFNISQGPIYFQLFVGDQGIKVNEIACRIGGAYEDEFIPLITGVDILKMVIDSSMGQDIDYYPLDNYNIENNENYLTVQLFFANFGTVQSITDRDEIIKLDGVYNMNYNYKENDFIKPIENASVRAGYVIITANTNQDIQKKVDNLYKKMLMLNKQGNNLIINRDYYKRYTE
ncbi:ATP-grasp domain-containing protein [Vallitalea guaymasensis]|uniref:ATP-grasp domain-containing protein n=1 Tax=Vallitalea guaymasensis TaxID=1185412 RepID=A0A8J8MBU0_9FIRM|nr:ATP-grasp domain-containing protein [Vallitalea guaymasensis]QUH30021.1 ATP-grasp domain-containing protein [Vallitalea guaymasensis]